VSDSNKELIEEYAERVAALQDELNTAQAGAEEALQLCATEQVIVTYISCRFPVFKGYHCMMSLSLSTLQENMQSEIALIRREQSERRAETAAALELMSVEKIQLEKERDSLAIELEVLRDMSGTDKASLDVERARVKEAMTVQQGLHMTKMLEKEDILYKLQEDYATLMDELVLVQKVNARLKDDISQAEAAREISLRELSEVKELKMELEAHNADLRSRNSDLEGMNSSKETELNRLRSANTELAVVKTESENYQKSYEAEQVQNRKLDDQLQSLRSQLAAAHRVSISSDTELTTLKREYDQLKMSSETAARLATEHINRVRRRYEDRERELLDALTIADNDVVTAKRETGRQKDGFVKEVAVLNATIGELELKVEDAKDAYATLSKSKYASEAIASQQTSHLQAEVSRLVNIETELQKVQEEHNAIVENLDRKCSILSAEKNGMHMTLSKQLNKQLVNLKEEMSVMSQTLEAKDFALEKMSARLHDMDVLNKQLENDVRLKTRDLTGNLACRRVCV
jgi:chromosome segregation ATPase